MSGIISNKILYFLVFTAKMEVENELSSIKERNKKVEEDKAWETSKARRLIIAAMTYFCIVIFLYLINAQNPWLTALIPAIGYLLSTLTMPIFKKWWIKLFYKR